MVYFLYALFFISCIVLVASVLLQPGKTDAGALFTSNVSSAAFGPRGTATILSKITIAAATLFMISALLLAMPALTGNVSVLQTTSESTAPPQTSTQPPITDLSNTNTNAATNVAPATNLSVDAPNANTPAATTNTANANSAKPAATNTNKK